MFCVKQINKEFGKNQTLEEYIKCSIRDFASELFEVIMLTEQEEYTNRKRYEHVGAEGKFTVYRNGYRYRNYITSYTGLIKLKVPRCRGGYFQPILFSKGVLTDKKIEDMIVHLWTDGNSYRDLREFVGKIYGARIGLPLLNRIIISVEKYVEEYHKKRIDYCYDAIYIDGLHTTIKEYPKRSNDEDIMKKHKNAVILGVLGQRREGKKIIREIIDYRICRDETTRDYSELLKNLKKRGLRSENIGVVVHDGEGSITAAIDNVYGKDKVKDQDCLVHRKRNILLKVKNKLNKEELGNDVWEVYSSETKEEFEIKHEQVLKKWQRKEPEAMEIFSDVKDNQLTKYDYELELHKDIHSNNPIERTFRELRRRIKPIGIFETVESTDRLIFLMVENLNQRRGSKPTNGDLKFTH